MHAPTFSENNIDYFYERLLICRDYHASFKTPLIDIGGDKWRERKVINHKIKDTPIDDINRYFSQNMLKRRRKSAENKDL